jgi:hypothetical protein
MSAHKRALSAREIFSQRLCRIPERRVFVPELAVFNARFYIRVRSFDEPS